jgi:hypothetical protein
MGAPFDDRLVLKFELSAILLQNLLILGSSGIAYFCGARIAACDVIGLQQTRRNSRLFIFSSSQCDEDSPSFLCLDHHPRSDTSPATARPSRVYPPAGAYSLCAHHQTVGAQISPRVWLIRNQLNRALG